MTTAANHMTAEEIHIDLSWLPTSEDAFGIPLASQFSRFRKGLHRLARAQVDHDLLRAAQNGSVLDRLGEMLDLARESSRCGNQSREANTRAEKNCGIVSQS